MAHVDESKLENCLEKESGITKFWEDEDIDLNLERLKVTSEVGLLTKTKVA